MLPKMISRLAVLAEQLGDLDDDISRKIEAFESALNSADPGVPFGVDDPEEDVEIAYRRENGRFQIVVLPVGVGAPIPLQSTTRDFRARFLQIWAEPLLNAGIRALEERISARRGILGLDTAKKETP